MGITVSEDEVNRLRIALGKISRLIDQQVSGDGLTRTQLSALGTLARAKRLGMGEFADIEGLNPTMLSRIVGKLEAIGLVQRTPDECDRRAVLVEITPAGSTLYTRMRRARTTLIRQRLAELPDAQAAALLDAIPALESLAGSLRTGDRAPAVPGDAVRSGSRS